VSPYRGLRPRPCWRRVRAGYYEATVSESLKDHATGKPLVAATVERISVRAWRWTWGQKDTPGWDFQQGVEGSMSAAKAEADRRMGRR
jgi:hypothetical protein